MLDKTPIVPNLSSTDLERTRAFYEDKLGLKLTEGGPDQGMLTFQAGAGTHLFVYAKEAVQPGDHTAISFWVSGIEELVAGLKAKGIAFEEYDTPEIKTEGGIASDEFGKAAWFKDPDGHIVGLYDMQG